MHLSVCQLTPTTADSQRMQRPDELVATGVSANPMSAMAFLVEHFVSSEKCHIA